MSHLQQFFRCAATVAMLAPLLAVAPPRASADTDQPETMEEILQDPASTGTMVILISMGFSTVIDICEEYTDTVDNLSTAAAAWHERNDPIIELARRTFIGGMAKNNPDVEEGDAQDVLDVILSSVTPEQVLTTMEQEEGLGPSELCATVTDDLASGSMDITGAPETYMPELFGPAIENMRGWQHRWQDD